MVPEGFFCLDSSRVSLPAQCSAAQGPPGGRFTFWGASPRFKVYEKERAVVWEEAGEKPRVLSSSPALVLEALWDSCALRGEGTSPGEGSLTGVSLPFCGGWVGYFGYDLRRWFEPTLPSKNPRDLPLPNFYLAFYDRFYLWDHWTRKGFQVILEEQGTWSSLREVLRAGRKVRKQKFKVHVERLSAKFFAEALSSSLLTSLPSGKKESPSGGISAPCTSNFSRREYIQTVRKAQRYIRLGEVYQLNLSQRFHAQTAQTPFELFWRLRELSPAFYGAYLHDHSWHIVSNSPELFLQRRGKTLWSRPIKGTAPRSSDPWKDRRLREALWKSAKDEAELAMIVDVVRNDFSRISLLNSVQVVDKKRRESFSNVHHLVATVKGRLGEDKSWMDILRATFPGASVTGAPKIRAMELIDELEPHRRDAYTGAIGWMDVRGHGTLSMAIRTMTLFGSSTVPRYDVYFCSGGGITIRSDPEREYEETLDKAKNLMNVVGC